jgi:hypothetical protein
MKEFRVTLTHRAGEIARLTQLLADRSIDLKSVVGVADNHKAQVCLVATDVAAMRSALGDARTPFTEEEVLSEIVDNEPGAVAALTAKLAEAGVNLHSLYILAREEPMVELGFTVDDPKKAKKALGI